MSNTDETGVSKNYRNGYSKKIVKTHLGKVDVKIPSDRNGEYEPQIIEKYNRNADGMEEKIPALYACGMSQSDISEQIKNLYDVEISDGLVSKITDKITPNVTAWQNRPPDAVYPFVFMDAIYYKIKENHQYITKAAYSRLRRAYRFSLREYCSQEEIPNYTCSASRLFPYWFYFYTKFFGVPFQRDSLDSMCHYDAAKDFMARKLPSVLVFKKIPADMVLMRPSLLGM